MEPTSNMILAISVKAQDSTSSSLCGSMEYDAARYGPLTEQIASAGLVPRVWTGVTGRLPERASTFQFLVS